MTAQTRAGGAMLGDRYELVRHIARGGMADVFEATDHQLGRQVAVKRFRAASPQDRPRFDAEVLVLARFNHPHLVQVYDAGEHDGDGYVVMELVDGPSLRAILQARPRLGPDEVAAMGSSLADALAYVHELGVVHRDVTPANVLCGTNGRVRLADFGIARLVDTSRITAVATTIGTAAYMAPEQLQGDDVTPAADVYALGLVLLEALAGRPGFGGTSAEAAVARLARDPDTTTGVPEPFGSLLTDMTARAPEARLTAGSVRDRLRDVMQAPGGAAGVATAVPSDADAPTVPVDALDGAVDPLAETRVVPVAGLAGAAAAVGVAATDGAEPVREHGASDAATGTAVMPVPLRHDDGGAMGAVGSASPSDRAAAARPRHVLWGLVAGLAAALLFALAASSGGGIDIPTATTEPVAETIPAPTTVAPETTAPPQEPAVDAEGEDEGRGNGKGNRDDDDDDD